MVASFCTLVCEVGPYYIAFCKKHKNMEVGPCYVVGDNVLYGIILI